LENTCVSRDGLRVFFQVTFQYQMTEENLYPAALEYRDYYKWAEVVESAARSGIHHACSEFQIVDFQQKRNVLQDRMFENLRIKLEGDGSGSSEGVFAKAISLQLNNVELPTEYTAAVAEKQSAEEGIALAKAERTQNVTKAETEFLSAQEEARRILATATTEAELLLMEAKLEAEETIYAFAQEAETLVKVKQTLNYTTEGVLAYMATKLIEEAPNLSVSTGEPAKLSRPNEL
jgi:regulator of protease activity HflC (stomatin/prohibitin superfamily)